MIFVNLIQFVYLIKIKQILAQVQGVLVNPLVQGVFVNPLVQGVLVNPLVQGVLGNSL